MGDKVIEEACVMSEEAAAGEAAVTAIDPRRAEWDIMVQLLELGDAGVEALANAGIKTTSDVELFGNGAATVSATSTFMSAPIEGLNLATKQKFLVVATYLLNDGKLTPTSTLAEMARANQSNSMAAATANTPTSRPVKRGRGRPRKHPISASAFAGAPAKRGRGRPPKNTTTAAAGSTPKRGPGRPRKHPLPGRNAGDDNCEPVAKRGRPRKSPASAGPTAKRGPGRPRKHPIPDSSPTPKRGPGRPPKNPPSAAASPGTVKRGPGRPRKHPMAEEAAAAAAVEIPPSTAASPGIVKRSPGRPRKHPIAEEAAAVAAGKPKRGRGRPRKHPIVDEAAAAEIKL